MTTWEERESENHTDSAESPGGGARDNDGVYVGGYHDTVADLKVLQSTRPRLNNNRLTSAALSLSPPDRQHSVSLRGVRRGGGEREEGAGGQQEVGKGA